jgi:two-component system, cell cycle sensor histidine kinase and response regulator CckA
VFGFSGLLSMVRQLDRTLRPLPDWLRRYVIALFALTVTLGLALILVHTVGTESTLIYSLLGDLLVLGCAWLGYGSGILVCTFVAFIVPHILLPGRPPHVDAGRFGTLVIMCLLVSRVSGSKRRTEVALRRLADEMETRFQERSLELQHNEARRAQLAAIVESSDDAIIGKTLDGTITSWNRAAEILYGYTAQEVVGRSITILIPPGSPNEVEAILRRIRNGEVIQHFQTVRLRKNGEPLVVSLTISPIRDSNGEIEGASTIARDMTAHRRAQQALEDSEHRYRLLFENNPQPVWVYDQGTLAFLAVNNTAVLSYGFSREEFLAMTLADIRPQEEVSRRLATAVPPNKFHRDGPWHHRKKNGQIIIVDVAEHALLFDGRPACLVMATDITDHLRLEEQFRQAQRLESVGRLAGGVAHDFNNLLTVINGYAEMLLSAAPAGSPTALSLSEIRKAGERAAGLTGQLLAFSRRQVLQLSVININAVVAETEQLLRRLIGEDVKLVTTLAPDLGLILADAGQVQQIIMNLAVNSRDAMPDGGTLHIETSNVTLDNDYQAEHGEAQPGPHIMLAITDTGTGMNSETRARIFEPFFTTKELGKGTGLGLATVYGMVKQGSGSIWVYSEPGRGTTFNIYLPRTDKPPSLMRPAAEHDLRGTETILIVEDYAEVLAVALSGLAGFGYSVHGARTGRQALAFCHEFPGAIHLVVTDVVMTDMNGRQVANQITQICPDARILFMSGYTANVIAHHGVLDAGVEYLPKPFTPESLARRVREVLDRPVDAN